MVRRRFTNRVPLNKDARGGGMRRKYIETALSLSAECGFHFCFNNNVIIRIQAPSPSSRAKTGELSLTDAVLMKRNESTESGFQKQKQRIFHWIIIAITHHRRRPPTRIISFYRAAASGCIIINWHSGWGVPNSQLNRQIVRVGIPQNSSRMKYT